MSDKTGIVDPWRVVEPVRGPPPVFQPKTQRINLADQDFDADMAPVKRGALDCKHGSLEVHGKQLHQMGDVLKNVIGCLFDLEHAFKDSGLDAASLAYTIGERRSAGWDDTPGAAWSTEAGFEPACELRFKKQTLDGGMLRLIRALRDLQRRPGGHAIFHKWGVRIIQR
jgi:hypothetical protein